MPKNPYETWSNEKLANFCMNHKEFKSPSFQFYPNDWFGSVKVLLMSPEARGIYINLLGRAWNSEDGGLPKEDDELYILASCTQKSFKRCSKFIKTCFFEHENRLFNRKLCVLRVLQNARREQASEAGKKSAESKKSKENEEKTQRPLNYRSTNVQRGGQRKANPPTPTPTSSPTPTPASSSENIPEAKPSESHSDFVKVFDNAYKKEFHTPYDYQKKDFLQLKNLIKRGVTLERFDKAVTNCSKDLFHRNNFTMTYICGNFSKLENFKETATIKGNRFGPQPPSHEELARQMQRDMEKHK